MVGNMGFLTGTLTGWYDIMNGDIKCKFMNKKEEAPTT